MSRDRSRNKYIRKSKRVVLVTYERENKTEKNYLSNFSGRNKDYIIKPVPGNETDPVNLIRQAIQKAKDLSLDLLEDDKAYCIFDADTKPQKNIQIDLAIKLAKENYIIPIVSVPCVELWFLLHYEYSTAIKNSKKLERYQKQNNKKLQSVDANPYTEMYKLVEELMK